MEFMEIENFLRENIDLKYKNFNENLLPGIENIQGIRLPVLRKLSKDIYKDGDYLNFLENFKEDKFEDLMLKGLVIAQVKDIEKSSELILNFVPKIDNWSVCDSFSNSLKISRKYPEQIYKLLIYFSKSPKEYERRFALVMFLSHYVVDEYKAKSIPLVNKIDQSDYYVEMAIAWLLTELYTKYPDYTYENLPQLEILAPIEKKFIRKVKDSFKISSENKKRLESFF